MSTEIEKVDKERIIVKHENFTAEYMVIKNSGEDMPIYGIMVDCGDLGRDSLENVFFTADEAYKRCEWLAENEVFAQGFRDVMTEIMA